MQAKLANQKREKRQMNHIIAERFKAARMLNKLSQEEAAKKLGFKNASFLSKIENVSDNQKTPPLNTLICARDLYGVSVDYLLGVTDEWNIEDSELKRVINNREVSDWAVKLIHLANATTIQSLAVISKQHNVIINDIHLLAEIAEQTNEALKSFMHLNKSVFEDMRGSNRLMTRIESMFLASKNASANLAKLKKQIELLNTENSKSLQLSLDF